MGLSNRSFKPVALGGAAVMAMLASGLMPAAAQSGDGAVLEISDFVGSVEIKRGDKLGYTLDMNEKLVPKPDIKSTNGKLSIASEQVEIRNCRVNNDKIKIQVKGSKLSNLEDFPKLVVTLPDNSDVSVKLNSGLLKMGDARNLDVNFTGCGDLYFGDVAHSLDVAIRGSGDVTGASAKEANIAIKGSGDFEIGDVAGPVNLQISGSGDAEFEDVDGDLKVDIVGSGDVEARSVEGDVSIRIKGSGDVEIGDGAAKNFSANVYGSGDVQFNGTADDVSVLLKGSGDVYVARLTGKKVVERHGSGDVRIGSWSSDDDG